MSPPSTAEEDPWLELRNHLYGRAYRTLPKPLRPRADDLVQELLAWALKKHPGRSPRSLRRLLDKHLGYRVIDEIKKAREEHGTLVPLPEIPPADPRDEESRLEDLKRQAEEEWLERYYLPRPRRERDVIELTELDGLTAKQAARRLQQTAANVYQIRSRTLNKLRRHRPPTIDQGDPE